MLAGGESARTSARAPRDRALSKLAARNRGPHLPRRMLCSCLWLPWLPHPPKPMRLCRRALASVSENGLLPLSSAETRNPFDCVAPPVCVEVQERACWGGTCSAGVPAREIKRGLGPGHRRASRFGGLLYNARLSRRRMAVVCAVLCGPATQTSYIRLGCTWG